MPVSALAAGPTSASSRPQRGWRCGRGAASPAPSGQCRHAHRVPTPAAAPSRRPVWLTAPGRQSWCSAPCLGCSRTPAVEGFGVSPFLPSPCAARTSQVQVARVARGSAVWRVGAVSPCLTGCVACGRRQKGGGTFTSISGTPFSRDERLQSRSPRSWRRLLLSSLAVLRAHVPGCTRVHLSLPLAELLLARPAPAGSQQGEER